MTTIEASAGPWRAETIEEDSTHCYIYSVGSDCVVATLDRREDASSKFRDRCIADATLMAAAPQMRDLLELLLRSYALQPSFAKMATDLIEKARTP